MRDRFADLASMPEEPVPVAPAVAEAPDDPEQPPDDTDGAFMEQFFTDVKTIRDQTREIEHLVNEVEIKHGDLLVAYSAEGTKNANVALDNVMAQISTVANRVRTSLKRMAAQNKTAEANDDSQGGSADLRIRKSQQSMLSRKFVAVMTTYNNIQAANKRKYRDAIKRQCKIVDPDISDATVDHLLETNTTADIFKGKRLDEAESALNEIKDRHDDILRLERSMQELHSMFLDMAILVSEQGDMIDRIESSVDRAQNFVHVARKKLKEAETLQSAARKKKICCFVLLVILVMIILGFIIDPFVGNGGGGGGGGGGNDCGAGTSVCCVGTVMDEAGNCV